MDKRSTTIAGHSLRSLCLAAFSLATPLVFAQTQPASPDTTALPSPEQPAAIPATKDATGPFAAGKNAKGEDVDFNNHGPKEEYEGETYEMIQVEEIDHEEFLDKPMNLARWVMGAKLYTYETGHLEMARENDLEEGSPSVLLTKDPAARYPMYVDSYKFVIDLGDYWMINMFEFMNYGAQGRAQVFYSDVLQDPNSSQWKPASPIVPFSRDGKIPLYLGQLDTRFVMIVIDNMARGEIGSFSVYGDLKMSQMRLAGGGLSQKELEGLSMKEREKYRPVRYDWATLHSGCRISHVSSGDPRYSNAMIDDDPDTIHQFKQEPETLIIMDLMEERECNRMSMLFSSDPGLFEIYFVHKLPDGMRTKVPTVEEEAAENAAEETASLGLPLPDSRYLASGKGSLGEFLALSQFAQQSKSTSDELPIHITYMPREFFKKTKPHLTYVSDGGQVSFRIEFQDISGRWAIIRYRRNFNSPERHGMLDTIPDIRDGAMPLRVSPLGIAPSPLTLLGQTGADDSETSNGLRVSEISIFGDIFVVGDTLSPVQGVQGGGGEGGGAPGGGGGGPAPAPTPPGGGGGGGGGYPPRPPDPVSQ